MIRRNSKNILKALAVCTGFFSLAACREHSILKDDLTNVDNINTFSRSSGDFEISFSNGNIDSMPTSNFTYSLTTVSSVPAAVAIGAYTDDFFGRTQAIAHFQMTPYSSQFGFPEGAVLDSAVLVLPFTFGSATGGYYGDTLSEMHWNIYETGDKLDRTRTYFSNQSTPEGDLIGSASFNYQQFKTGSQQVIGATNDTTVSQLRMRLNSGFAQEIFNTDPANYANTTAFQEFFKGVTIAPDMSKPQNLLAFFLLPNSSSDAKSLQAARIEFHYHVNDEKDFKSIVMRQTVCGYYSNLVRTFDTYPVSNFFNRSSDSILIQSQPGAYTDVTIKGLNSIPLSVINKAEMVITVQPPAGNRSYLTAPDLIVPVLVKDGREEVLFERLDNSGAINGDGVYIIDPYLKTVTIDGREYSQYKINIPRTVQQYILSGTDEMTIRLKGSNYYPGMHRVLAKGITGAPDGTNFQFNIIYTNK